MQEINIHVYLHNVFPASDFNTVSTNVTSNVIF